MEIQAVLRLLIKKWWVILAAVLITVVSTLVFTSRLPRIYSSTVTYVVTPSPELLNASSFVNGLSVLGGQSTIVNTYSSIATSAKIREEAVKALGINQQVNSTISVSARVRSGTNMIEITVEGSDPALIQSFANQVGQSTLEYVGTLYEVYDMKMLDGAALPMQAIRPNMKINLAISAVLGFALGIGLAFLLGWFGFGEVHARDKKEDLVDAPAALENA